MPNARTHSLAGSCAGVAIGLATLETIPEDMRVPYLLGTLGGGLAGGLLPDLLEPAIHPWHRDIAHGVSVGGLMVAGLRQCCEPCSSWRVQADALRGERFTVEAGSARAQELFRQEAWLYAWGGAQIGACAGYLSHVVLDAGTARGIPLIARRLV